MGCGGLGAIYTLQVCRTKVTSDEKYHISGAAVRTDQSDLEKTRKLSIIDWSGS
jgi:hypothetical protein